MSLTFNITPGYNFSASEKVTYPKLNLLGSPVIISEGQASTAQIADGAITDAKLANPIDINSKLNDHNIDLDKLASGTHGQILYYNSTGDLVTLAPGTSGKFLKTQGPGADPKWEAQAGIGTITVSQIGAGSNGDHLVTTGGAAVWEADSRNQLKTHDTAGTGTFNASTSWASDGVVITATPTEASDTNIWSSWITGLDPNTIIASPPNFNSGFYTDFTINTTVINAAYSSGISSFDTDVNELHLMVEMFPEEYSYICLGVYNGTNYVPVAMKYPHLVGSADRTEFTREMVVVPRLESGQIRLRWLMREGYASGNGDRAFFQMIGHK